jgi:adenine-specific DNA-methyltransferase
MGNVSTSNDMTSTVLNELRTRGTNLGSICNINCGIQTGCDRIKVNGEYQGVFVLDDSETHGIPTYERKLLKPFFKNSDVKRYYCSPTTPLQVIYTDRSFNRPSDYPGIIAHLAKFRNRLNRIREVKNRVIKYYQLQWPRDENIFKAAKIVAPQRSKSNTFAFNEEDWYASVDVYFLTQKDSGISLKYVLALLNSKLLFFWLYRQGKRKGEMLELYQKPLSEIPVKRIPRDKQKPLITLVDKILSAKQRDAEADTTSLEREIDRLVYDLYELTPAEIKVVEESTAR